MDYGNYLGDASAHRDAGYRAYGKARLLKLADHLESGELMHKEFNFTTWNRIEGKQQFGRNGCGTMGCAIGECPMVFPESWEFRETNQDALIRFSPRLREDTKKSNPLDDAKVFFSLADKEAAGLFLPYYHPPWGDKYCYLGRHATAAQVAGAIRKFVAWKDNGGVWE